MGITYMALSTLQLKGGEISQRAEKEKLETTERS